MADKVKGHGKVGRRDAGGSDWDGRKIVRLDMTDGHGRDMHLYVAADHPLATTQVGAMVRFSVD